MPNYPALFQQLLPYLPLAIVAFGLYQAVALLRRYSRARTELMHFQSLVEKAPRVGPTELRAGLTLEGVEAIRLCIEGQTAFARVWWERLDLELERFSLPDFGDRWFLLRPPGTILTESLVVDHQYRPEVNHSIPGLLTASGLLCTFVSIVIAPARVNNFETVGERI